MPVPGEQRLQVRITSGADGSLVDVHGDVDSASWSRLGRILTALINVPEIPLVLDLRRIGRLCSRGVETLALLVEQCSTPAHEFEVRVRSGSQPESVLRQAGVHRLFSVAVWEGLDDPMNSVPGAVELRLPADVCQVSRVRSLTEQVLCLAGLDDGWLSDFVTAVGEAVANAVTHGSPPGSAGYVTYYLVPGDRLVMAEVRDFGNGIRNWDGHPRMPPPESIRGRGLGMMDVFTDRLEVNTGSGGTVVRLCKYCPWT